MESVTLIQHWPNIESAFFTCWDGGHIGRCSIVLQIHIFHITSFSKIQINNKISQVVPLMFKGCNCHSV